MMHAQDAAQRGRGNPLPAAPLKTLCLCAILVGCGAASSTADPVTNQESHVDWSGRIRGVYDYRELGDEKDADAYGYWYIRGRNLVDQHLDLYSSGRYHRDTDGAGASYADDLFTSAEDSDGDDDTRLLQMYLDLHTRDEKLQLRAGRQYVDVADYIQMDGAQVMLFERDRIGGRVFFGKPVSFYSAVSGDTFGGASIVGRPWDGNVSRLTFATYSDDSIDSSDEHLFLNIRQRATDSIQARGQLSLMNGDFRMGGLDLWYFAPETVSDIVLGVRQWGEYDADTRVYSPLYDVLGDQEPYTYAYARVTQEVLPWFLVSPGAAMRMMNSDDQDAYNREYGHYDVAFIVEPNKAWDGSVSVEYWDVEEGDSFFGVSGELRYRHAKRWEISGGAAYLDYEYNQFSDFTFSTVGGDTRITAEGTQIEMSPDVYTYFLRGRWNVNRHLVLRLHGEVEDDSLEDDLSYRGRCSAEWLF